MEKMNVLVAGGDARTLEVIAKLAEKGISVYAAGFEKVNFESTDIQHTKITDTAASHYDAILLPVRGTDGSGNVTRIWNFSVHIVNHF